MDYPERKGVFKVFGGKEEKSRESLQGSNVLFGGDGGASIEFGG